MDLFKLMHTGSFDMAKNSKYIISVDLGTSYIKGGLYNSKGYCLASSKSSYLG